MILLLIIAALSALWSGMTYDAGALGISFAFGAISVVCVFCALLMYLNSGTSKG